MWIDSIISTSPKPKEEMLDSNTWVDVRDVALAHVLALEKPDAGGERIIVTAGAPVSIIVFNRCAGSVIIRAIYLARVA